MSITQTEFDCLIQMQKRFQKDNVIHLGSAWSRDIISIESKDIFILHYNLSSIDIRKFSYHKTYRKTIPLLRFDFKRHTNPDGKIFKGAHVHIYREGFDDKFAFPVSEIGIDENNLTKDKVLESFLQYCNVINSPNIIPILF